MTEADYLAEQKSVMRLHQFAAPRSPLLKHRLVASAACRLSPRISPECGPGLSLIEDHARGLLPDDALAMASPLLGYRHDPPGHWLQMLVSTSVGPGAAFVFERVLARRSTWPSYGVQTRLDRATIAAACDLVRDICGNPFRPWLILPPWMGQGVIQPTGEEVRFAAPVHQLAQVIDRHRHYDRLPILADAFEESGVTDAELLDHCRGGGSHYPGCWAVDLALGRTIRAK